MRESRFIHMPTLAYLSPLTTCRPTFPTVPTQPISALFEDNAALIEMIHKGLKPRPEGMSQGRTESIWIGCSRRVNLDHCMLIKYVRTNDQFADIFYLREHSPRCNGIHCSICGNSGDLVNQVMSAAFLANCINFFFAPCLNCFRRTTLPISKRWRRCLDRHDWTNTFCMTSEGRLTILCHPMGQTVPMGV